MASLSETDNDLLTHLREGGTVAGYAREHSYSTHWAKWKSRSLRHRFGVDTLAEVLQVTDDDGVSRRDFDELLRTVGRLGDALEDLGKRDGTQEREQVRVRELDLKDHAKALGLSLEDVQKIRDEKDYERFKGFFDRRDAELAAEEEEADKNSEGDGKGKGVVEKMVDGLGGIRNVDRTKTT